MLGKLYNLLVWKGRVEMRHDIGGCFFISRRDERHKYFSCCCLGNWIFILENSSDITLNHELGHRVQYWNMGVIKYYLFVGLPSIFGNLWDRVFHKNWMNVDRERWYYNLPWEKEADELGGVHRW